MGFNFSKVFPKTGTGHWPEEGKISVVDWRKVAHNRIIPGPLSGFGVGQGVPSILSGVWCPILLVPGGIIKGINLLFR